MALVGVLWLWACSPAGITDEEPDKEAKISLRRISANEVMGILSEFPEMVPSYLAEQRNDTGLFKLLFPFKEVTSARMERVFPGVRFYQGLDLSRTDVEYPYMFAIAGGKRFAMPNGFNRLLVDNGQKVTDKNIVELAEAFVISAIGSERYYSFPEIVFLETRRIEQVISTISYDAWLKVKIGDRVEEWYFDRWYGQFAVVSRGNAKGLIRQYDVPDARPLPQRGQLDETPSMDMEADTNDAYASGREPAEDVEVTTRRISASEVMGILDKFPGLLLADLSALQKRDTELVVRLHPFVEVNASPLEHAFPAARLFQGRASVV